MKLGHVTVEYAARCEACGGVDWCGDVVEFSAFLQSHARCAAPPLEVRELSILLPENLLTTTGDLALDPTDGTNE